MPLARALLYIKNNGEIRRMVQAKTFLDAYLGRDA